MISYARYCAASLGVLAVAALSGCQPEERVVARVNNEKITEPDFNTRVQSVTTIPQGISTDAGGMTLVNMIRTVLTDQLAQKMKCAPSQDTVSSAVAYTKRADPQTATNVASGRISDEDLMRQKKYELEAFGIGTAGDRASEQDIDKTYNDPAVQKGITLQLTYTVLVLPVPSEAAGQEIIADIKKTGDFAAAAKKLPGLPAANLASATQEQTLPADHLPTELRDALDKLKPGEVTPATVTFQVSDPQQPGVMRTIHVVAQLKHKEPERIPAKGEVRFWLEQMILQKSHPAWSDHYRRELAAFTKNSDVVITLPKYKGLIQTFILPLANSEASRPPTGMPAVPQ